MLSERSAHSAIGTTQGRTDAIYALAEVIGRKDTFFKRVSKPGLRIWVGVGGRKMIAEHLEVSGSLVLGVGQLAWVKSVKPQLSHVMIRLSFTDSINATRSYSRSTYPRCALLASSLTYPF